MSQINLFDEKDDPSRSLLDELLQKSKLYHHSTGYRALLDFVVRLRNFAPFNAMLLQLQKPGLRLPLQNMIGNNASIAPSRKGRDR